MMKGSQEEARVAKDRRRKDGDGEACGAYDAALSRVWGKVCRQAGDVSSEQAEARRFLGELLEMTPEQRRLLVRNRTRLHSWAVADRILAASEEAWFKSPEDALDLADLGRFAARLIGERVGDNLAADLEARAWAYRANCLRILGQLEGAQAAMARARRCRDQGTGDRLLAARMADLQASLSSQLQEPEAALRQLDKAYAIYDRTGDRHLMGRTSVAKATILLEQGDAVTAGWLLRKALRLLDPQRDPRLEAVARHNLVCCALAAGEVRQARALLDSCRSRPLPPGAGLKERRILLERLVTKALAEAAPAGAPGAHSGASPETAASFSGGVPPHRSRPSRRPRSSRLYVPPR